MPASRRTLKPETLALTWRQLRIKQYNLDVEWRSALDWLSLFQMGTSGWQSPALALLADTVSHSLTALESLILVIEERLCVLSTTKAMTTSKSLSVTGSGSLSSRRSSKRSGLKRKR